MEERRIWAAIVVSFTTVIAGLYQYFRTPAHEIRWKQTEFVLAQAHYLETDEDIIDAVMVLRNEYICTIRDIFSKENKLSIEEIYNYRRKFYKLFNLLDRLAYLCLDKTAITISEMSNFGTTR